MGRGSSPSVIGPGDSRWDLEFDFDDAGWDAPIRGRAVPVPVGAKEHPIVRSMLRKQKDDPIERIVRLTLRATGAALSFVVVSALDSEEIVFVVNVPAGGARSISFSCDRFLVTASHSLSSALNQGNGGTPGLAHFRIDDRAGGPSVWSVSQAFAANADEKVLTPPPFADSLTILSVANQAGTLRYYESDVTHVDNLRATLPILGAQQASIPVNDLGATTLQGGNGVTIWLLNWRCLG